MERKNKRTFVSRAQKEFLIKYMNKHPELAAGKFSSDFTRSRARKMWERLTPQLNSMVGAKRVSSQWRNTWKDLKKNAKSKFAGSRDKNGGSGNRAPINSGDDEILNIIHQTGGYEIRTVPDSKLLFSFDQVNRGNEIELDEISNHAKDDNAFFQLDYAEQPSLPTEEAIGTSINTIQDHDSEKISRLRESTAVSKQYVHMANSRSRSNENYQKEKLRLLKERQEQRRIYENKKLDILCSFVNELKDIKHLLFNQKEGSVF